MALERFTLKFNLPLETAPKSKIGGKTREEALHLFFTFMATASLVIFFKYVEYELSEIS